jgi:hypothetical protein
MTGATGAFNHQGLRWCRPGPGRDSRAIELLDQGTERLTASGGPPRLSSLGYRWMVANSCDVMHLGRAAGALMLAARSRSFRGLAASHRQAGPRPLTYHEASTLYNPVTARQRYDELTDRDLCARTVALLRGRGESTGPIWDTRPWRNANR